MCRWNLYHYDLLVCAELQVLSKTASRLWFYAYKKYKNGNSARRTATQRHIRPAICSGGSDNFSSGISGKFPKIATSDVIFSITADRIAAKFYMTIKKIKPNDIFHNCVHSCSSLIVINQLMVRMKRPHTIVKYRYCTSQPTLPCPSVEATVSVSRSYTFSIHCFSTVLWTWFDIM